MSIEQATTVISVTLILLFFISHTRGPDAKA